MNLPQNIKAFLKQVPLRRMKGEEIFVAITFFLSDGKKDVEILIKDIKNKWSKTLIRKSYNPAFANRAQGHVDPRRKGSVCLTNEGVEYIESLILSAPVYSSALVIFKKGDTHSFDKFLRSIFKKAKRNICIADTYVAGNIFDNLLDEAAKTIPIRFLFGSDCGGFVAKSQRFTKEYDFNKRESSQFHDRFLLVDGMGYIIGPSLKDAADRKPAVLVALNKIDSKKLNDLFLDLWNGK